MMFAISCVRDGCDSQERHLGRRLDCGIDQFCVLWVCTSEKREQNVLESVYDEESAKMVMELAKATA